MCWRTAALCFDIHQEPVLDAAGWSFGAGRRLKHHFLSEYGFSLMVSNAMCVYMLTAALLQVAGTLHDGVAPQQSSG